MRVIKILYYQYGWTLAVLNRGSKIYLSFDKLILGFQILNLKEIIMVVSIVHYVPWLATYEYYILFKIISELLQHKPPSWRVTVIS